MLIISKIANQSARKALFTCVVYEKSGYLCPCNFCSEELTVSREQNLRKAVKSKGQIKSKDKYPNMFIKSQHVELGNILQFYITGKYSVTCLVWTSRVRAKNLYHDLQTWVAHAFNLHYQQPPLYNSHLRTIYSLLF